MLKNFLIKNWPLIIVNLVVIIFFARLFFPPSTYTTPDFGRTDILHISLPEKLIESQFFREFNFSLWENRAGNGYSVLPESVFFFLPNILMSILFPFNIAIPFCFLSTFLISANSMYYLLRKLNLEKLSAAFGAIAFTFSAAMILNIPHITVAQAISIIPLAIALNINLLKKIDKKTVIIFAIILSQILVTFTQIYVYLILLLIILNFFHLFFERKKGFVKYTIIFIIAIIFSLIFSTGQIIANYEALKSSQRDNGVNPESILSGFPLLPKNLLTFIDPFIVGKASNGTYNNSNWSTNGLYWESTAYIGILPFIISIFAIFYTLKSKSRNIYTYILILTLISFALALGKLAPLHVLFSFPPLNFFRVPARFIIFTQIFLIIFSALGFNTLLKISGKFLKLIIIFSIPLITINFYIKWWDYHPIESLKSVEQKPQILESLTEKNLTDSKFYFIRDKSHWNDVFTTSGWESKEDYYKFFRNSLEPNLNFIYGFNQFSSYQVLPSNRQNLQQLIVAQNTKVNENSIEFKESTKKAINIYSIKYIVTAIPLDGNFEKLGEVTKDNYKYYLYENKEAMGKFQFYYNFETIKYVGDYMQAFQDKDLTKTVLIENNPSFNPQEGEYNIKINKQSSANYELELSTSKPGILVLNDSYSKDWKAKIDDKPTMIYPANINTKSIIIPEGKHKIRFYYQPINTYIGIMISFLAYLIALIFLVKKSKLIDRLRQIRII